MAKHIVKCKICGLDFDLNQEQGVIAGARRYAHHKCLPTGELVPMETPPAEDPDLKTLKDYISKIYGEKANWALINKQIKKFKKDNNYSYSGMFKSLVYFYEVKHNSVENSNGGIGIIEFCYQDAYQYYLAIFMAQNNNENKTFIQKVKEYIIKPPKSISKANKILNWGEEDEE